MKHMTETGNAAGEQMKREILFMMWETAGKLVPGDVKSPSLEFADIVEAARKTCDAAPRADVRAAMRGCLDYAEQDLSEWFEHHRPAEPADGRVLLCDHLRRIVSGQMRRNYFLDSHNALEILDSEDGPFTTAFGDILEFGHMMETKNGDGNDGEKNT